MQDTRPGTRSAAAEHDELTSAQRFAEIARHVLETQGQAAFDRMLCKEFVQESRRRDAPFEFDRIALLDGLESMRRFDVRITGQDIAVAGEHHLLTLRGYEGPAERRELLAVSVWDDDGNLTRLIEFDPEEIDAALAELAAVSGLPVRRVDGH